MDVPKLSDFTFSKQLQIYILKPIWGGSKCTHNLMCSLLLVERSLRNGGLYSHIFNIFNTLLTFIYLFYFKRWTKREREIEIFVERKMQYGRNSTHYFIQSPNADNSHWWSSLVINFIWISHVGNRGQTTWATTCC